MICIYNMRMSEEIEIFQCFSAEMNVCRVKMNTGKEKLENKSLLKVASGQ